MSGPLKDVKVTIDKPHDPHGPHVDIITPLSNIRGADKTRIGPDGKILSNEINIKGGQKKSI